MKVAIYELRDPTTNEVKYIGQTARPLWKRLNAHLSDGRRKGHAKWEWIAALLAQGLRPVIAQIDECDSVDALSIEAWWINEKSPPLNVNRFIGVSAQVAHMLSEPEYQARIAELEREHPYSNLFENWPYCMSGMGA